MRVDRKQFTQFSKFKILRKGNHWVGGDFSPKRSGRMKQSRTSETFQKKLNQFKSTYTHLFKESKKAKEAFNQLSEEEKVVVTKRRSQKRTEPKSYFCDKYPTMNSFVETFAIRKIAREEPKKAVVTVDKKEAKRKVGGR